MDPRSFADVTAFLEKGSIPHLGTCTGDLMADKDDVHYKGMGLGMLVALICSSSGSPLTTVTASAHDEKRRVVHVFEASRIDALFPQDEALERIAAAVSFYRGMGPKMKLPGQIETETKARSLREGIVYSEDQILRLRKAGEHVGVDPDAFL